MLAGAPCWRYSIWNQYRLEVYAQETWRNDFLMDGFCAVIPLRDYFPVDSGVYRMVIPTGHPNGDMLLDAALARDASGSTDFDTVQDFIGRLGRREDLTLHCEGSADTRRGYLSLVNCQEVE